MEETKKFRLPAKLESFMDNAKPIWEVLGLGEEEFYAKYCNNKEIATPESSSSSASTPPSIFSTEPTQPPTVSDADK